MSWLEGTKSAPNARLSATSTVPGTPHEWNGFSRAGCGTVRPMRCGTGAVGRGGGREELAGGGAGPWEAPPCSSPRVFSSSFMGATLASGRTAPSGDPGGTCGAVPGAATSAPRRAAGCGGCSTRWGAEPWRAAYRKGRCVRRALVCIAGGGWVGGRGRAAAVHGAVKAHGAGERVCVHPAQRASVQIDLQSGAGGHPALR